MTSSCVCERKKGKKKTEEALREKRKRWRGRKKGHLGLSVLGRGEKKRGTGAIGAISEQGCIQTREKKEGKRARLQMPLLGGLVQSS